MENKFKDSFHTELNRTKSFVDYIKFLLFNSSREYSLIAAIQNLPLKKSPFKSSECTSKPCSNSLRKGLSQKLNTLEKMFTYETLK